MNTAREHRVRQSPRARPTRLTPLQGPDEWPIKLRTAQRHSDIPTPRGLPDEAGCRLPSPSAASCDSGRATADLDRAGTLSSYESLARSDGILTHAEVYAQRDLLLAAKTVTLVPTAFASVQATAVFDADQRKLVAGVIDRSLCHGLSARLKVVLPGAPSDLVVHAVVTRVLPTNAAFAGASKVIGVLPSILLPGVPIPVPRVPIGLGSLTIEVEAVTASKQLR